MKNIFQLYFRLLSQMKFNRCRVKCFQFSGVHPYLYLVVSFVAICQPTHESTRNIKRELKEFYFVNFDIHFATKVIKIESENVLNRWEKNLISNLKGFHSKFIHNSSDRSEENCENITENKNGCRVTLKYVFFMLNVVVLFPKFFQVKYYKCMSVD